VVRLVHAVLFGEFHIVRVRKRSNSYFTAPQPPAGTSLSARGRRREAGVAGRIVGL
jgi:hypothetical protein